jgi:hypothetical protein
MKAISGLRTTSRQYGNSLILDCGWEAEICFKPWHVKMQLTSGVTGTLSLSLHQGEMNCISRGAFGKTISGILGSDHLTFKSSFFRFLCD